MVKTLFTSVIEDNEKAVHVIKIIYFKSKAKIVQYRVTCNGSLDVFLDLKSAKKRFDELVEGYLK